MGYLGRDRSYVPILYVVLAPNIRPFFSFNHSLGCLPVTLELGNVSCFTWTATSHFFCGIGHAMSDIVLDFVALLLMIFILLSFLSLCY